MTESLWTRQELGIKANVEKCGYALNYIGGKRKISHELLSAMLDDCGMEKPIFYDVFGGGAAMSFQASHFGLKTIYNDLNKNLYALFNDIEVIKSDECIDFFRNNFITKPLFKAWQNSKDYFALKTALLNCYSYGGVFAFYTFNDVNQHIKKHCHYAVCRGYLESFEAVFTFYCGKSNNSKLCGLIFNLYEKIKSLDWIERYTAWQDFFIKFEALRTCEIEYWHSELGKSNLFDKVIEAKQVDILSLANKKLGTEYKGIKYIEGYDSTIPQIKHIAAFLGILELCDFEKYDLIEWNNNDFRAFEIKHSPDECIVYADIPYEIVGNRIYKENIESKFPFDEFYEWARNLTKKGYNVYCSEYTMPDDFKVLKEIDYKSTMCRENGFMNKEVKERLFKCC